MGLSTILRTLADAALDVVAPPACLACAAGPMGESSLCDRCRALLRVQPRGTCARCAALLGPGAEGGACIDCERLRPRFSATIAAARYAGLAGELIRRAKYGRDPLLSIPLSALLRGELRAAASLPEIDVVVPVPAHPGRSAERGFHLADLLAEAAAEEVGVPAHADWLVRVGDPVPQAALPRTERRLAARGTVALRARPRLRVPWTRPPEPSGRRVLVVDDVLTTGATVNECARVLIEAGAADVVVAVVARA